MNDMFCISIIIPVYNVGTALSRCLDSILHQSYKYFEVLLIDDGSTDGSGLICDEYVRLDDRFCVFHQKNKGVSAARNKGISLATGDYVTFIDADDWISSTYLSDLVSYLSLETDILFYGGICMTENCATLYSFKSEDLSSFRNETKSLIEYAIEANIFGHVWLMWIKLNIIKDNDIRFNEQISLHEDFIFTCECVSVSKHFLMADIQPYRYVQYKNVKRDNLSAHIPDNYEYIAVECLKTLKKMEEHQLLNGVFIHAVYKRMQQQFYIGCIDVICRNKCLKLSEKEILIERLNASLGISFPINLYNGLSSFKNRVFQFLLNTRNVLLICCYKKIGSLFNNNK